MHASLRKLRSIPRLGSRLKKSANKGTVFRERPTCVSRALCYMSILWSKDFWKNQWCKSLNWLYIYCIQASKWVTQKFCGTQPNRVNLPVHIRQNRRIKWGKLITTLQTKKGLGTENLIFHSHNKVHLQCRVNGQELY